MGIGCCALGYADDDVDDAVRECIREGSMTSLNCYEEVELAELLLKLNPDMSMVRFSRLGCDALSQAIRVARTHTGKSKVLYYGYHGWHDWYMAEYHGGVGPNGQPNLGIPKCLRKKIGRFELDADLTNVAAVIIEPALFTLGAIDEICMKTFDGGVPLIYDEITSGFREELGGVYLNKSHKYHPDIVVYGKAMGNGYPICAILGNEDIMQSYNDTFISSTFNTERVGFCAALATLEKMKKINATVTLKYNGALVKRIVHNAAVGAGLKIMAGGIDPLATFDFDDSNTMHRSNYFATLYQQEMVKKGYLAGSQYYASVAHDKFDEFNQAVTRTMIDIVALNVKLEGREIKSGVKHT